MTRAQSGELLSDTLRIKAPYLNGEWPEQAALMREAAARIEGLQARCDILADAVCAYNESPYIVCDERIDRAIVALSGEEVGHG